MHLRFDGMCEAPLRSLGLEFKVYDGEVYLQVGELRENYDKIAEVIGAERLARLVRLDTVVFSADFEVLKAVG